MDSIGTCYVVGAGDFTARDFAPKRNPPKQDLVIAADGGYLALQSIHCMPDLLLGDFDSMVDTSHVPAELPMLRHPVHKNDTDTSLALDQGWERGYRDFVLYGCGGGRLDHLLANIQCMCRLSKLGGHMRLVDQAYDLYTLTNGTLTLPPRPAGTLVSVFCHGSPASGVTLRGLLYPLTNATLVCDTPLGVSNQFLSSAEPAAIAVENGTVVVMAYVRP
ncbi:MAG: thiamine diphosphokinase [Clostridia bacterium]